MADRENERRFERALDESRDWVERTAEDVTDRLGRAWQSVRARLGEDEQRSDSSEPEAATFAKADLDDAELFSRERQREVESLGHANILVIGQVGVGKSTLINLIPRFAVRSLLFRSVQWLNRLSRITQTTAASIPCFTVFSCPWPPSALLLQL